MFNKNDLMSLPFDKIKQRVEDKITQLEQTLLNDIQSTLRAANNKRVQELMSVIPDTGESGSDGIEESIREAITLADEDVELTEEQKLKIAREARIHVVNSFVTHCNLGSKHSWVLPQMIATFGTWKAVRNEETGLYDAAATRNLNTQDPFNYGLWAVSMLPRSELIEVTDKKEPMYKLKAYNGLVPLILAGFKQYQNINYAAWDRNTIPYLVNEELGKAMLCTLPEMSVQDIMDLRVVAQTTKSGNRMGKQGSPITTAGMFHLGDYKKHDVTELPRLALHMLCQTWLAHPANRSPNVQILNPAAWDDVPAPLIGSVVISNKPEYDWGSSKKAGIYDNPW